MLKAVDYFCKKLRLSMFYSLMNTALMRFLQLFTKTFYVLAKFPFATSETELDCYHQKLSIPVASRVAEQPKTLDL